MPAIGLVLSKLLYRMFAERALQFETHHSFGIDRASFDALVSEPTTASMQLAELLGRAPNAGLVDDFFLSGYRAAMALLVVVTLFAVAMMTALIRHSNSAKAEER